MTDPDGADVVVQCWEVDAPRAAVHVLHGFGEHAGRYARLAAALNDTGFDVWADDHRGHGRTALAAGGLGDFGPRGADGTADAVEAVTNALRAAHPGQPVFVVGHSWGSFLAQRLLARYAGAGVAGIVLVGTTLLDPARPRTGGLNQAFEPARTPYDWLSRDEAEVDAYIADPWCGFEAVQRGGAGALAAPPATDPLPATLPVLVLNGSADPIGGRDGAERLAAHLRARGLDDVRCAVYLDARHEVLNETNRDEVTADLVSWLEARIGT